MSLIDDLREVGAALPPSHIPGLAEALPLLGALLVSAEHDVEKVVDAVRADAEASLRGEPATELHNILAPPDQAPDVPTQQAPPAASPAVVAEQPTPVPVDIPSNQAELSQERERNTELEAEVASLRQQLQNAQASEQRTTATVEPLDPVVPEPSPAPTEPGASTPTPEGPVS